MHLLCVMIKYPAYGKHFLNVFIHFFRFLCLFVIQFDPKYLTILNKNNQTPHLKFNYKYSFTSSSIRQCIM